jgi:16S rRNA (cytidine1402-2'-O)-methyltransferase
MEQGTLYIIATPIGNLEDITLRALRILQEVDLIAAEDTRKTLILLKHYNIRKPLTSYFEHNEQRKAAVLIAMLKSGKNIGLVSEAGTPTISDPGYVLVTQARAEAIPVVPIPGVSAAIAAISVSGLPVHRFAFEGFLPARSGKRKGLLRSLAEEPRTLIFYESPYRIVETIKDMIDILGDRPAMLGREITKLHEESICGSLAVILEKLAGRRVRGECTVVVRGYGKSR